MATRVAPRVQLESVAGSRMLQPRPRAFLKRLLETRLVGTGLCISAMVTWAEGGNSAYHRAHVDGLIDTLHQADASYDAATRQQLFVQAQKLMYESAWFGYIWFEPGNFLVHNRIQGFPATWGSFREAEWWINAA
jgi:ABC-type transport system substrate-binding protein